MRRVVALAFITLGFSVPAFAQTSTTTIPIVHAGNYFYWEQEGPSLDVVSKYAYTPKKCTTFDATATPILCTAPVMQAALTNVQCIAGAAATPLLFPCKAPIGTRTVDTQAHVIVAIETLTFDTLESPASQPVAFTFRGPAAAPRNPRTGK